MTDTDNKAQQSLFTQDFQKGVLKLLMSNVQFVAHHGTLVKEEYFDTHILRVICTLIKEYVFTYEKELDLSSLNIEIDNYANRFGLSDDVINEFRNEARLVSGFYIASEQFYVDNLLRFVRKQELKNAIFKSVDILEKDGAYDQVLHLIDKAVGVGTEGDTEISFKDLKDIPHQYLKTYSPDKLITTGFPTWDTAFKGGMAPGEIHVILAPPKAGKSSTLVNVGVANLKRNKAVFHISLEISKEDVAMKYAMNLSGMALDQVTRMSPQAFHHKMARYDELKPNLYINFWPECTIGTTTIRSWISRVRSRTGVSPDLIIVDYDDCLIPNSGKAKDDMYNDAGNVYSDLIQLASYFKCPIITAAQPQREAWESPNDGKLITHDKLAHSARKAHKTWSISSLNFTDEQQSGILYVDIARRGESKVKVKIQKDLSRCVVREIGQ